MKGKERRNTLDSRSDHDDNDGMVIIMLLDERGLKYRTCPYCAVLARSMTETSVLCTRCMENVRKGREMSVTNCMKKKLRDWIRGVCCRGVVAKGWSLIVDVLRSKRECDVRERDVEWAAVRAERRSSIFSESSCAGGRGGQTLRLMKKGRDEGELMMDEYGLWHVAILLRSERGSDTHHIVTYYSIDNIVTFGRFEFDVWVIDTSFKAAAWRPGLGLA
jgi:hypothetical protein